MMIITGQSLPAGSACLVGTHHPLALQRNLYEAPSHDDARGALTYLFLYKDAMRLSKPDVEAILQARRILQQDFRWQLPISQLSVKVGINERKLKAGFKKIVKLSIHEFLVQVRMEKAKELLQETNKTIEEIAALVGYKDRTSFSREFRKRFGEPPSRWGRGVISVVNRL